MQNIISLEQAAKAYAINYIASFWGVPKVGETINYVAADGSDAAYQSRFVVRAEDLAIAAAVRNLTVRLPRGLYASYTAHVERAAD